MRKRISIAAALLIALLVITGCSGSDKSKLPVPEDLKGTWVNSDADQRMVISDDNIIYETGYTTMNFSEIIRVQPNMYEVTYTDTSLTITADTISAKYDFRVSNGVLSFTITTGGMEYPAEEFTK